MSQVLNLLCPDATPTVLELYQFNADGLSVTAISGTGFDPDNPAHSSMFLPDALRYAIAIQRLRDNRRFSDADVARRMVRGFGLEVTQTAHSTCVAYRIVDSGKCRVLFCISAAGQILHNDCGES